jgi:hypothetical protein
VEIEAFLAEVAARNGVNNWQVQQARDALEPRPDMPKSQGIASRMVAPRPKSWDATIINPSGLNYETPVEGVKYIPESNSIFRPIARDALNPAPIPTQPTVSSVWGVKSTGSVNRPVLDARVRECLHLEHYSYRKEQTYGGGSDGFLYITVAQSFHVTGRGRSSISATPGLGRTGHVRTQNQTA